jgi:hypothetical protein
MSKNVLIFVQESQKIAKSHQKVPNPYYMCPNSMFWQFGAVFVMDLFWDPTYSSKIQGGPPTLCPLKSLPPPQIGLLME